MTSKCFPFWMLLAPYFTKSAFRKGTRKCIKSCIQKVSNLTSKVISFFAQKCLQDHTNPSLGLKMCPKPPGGVPRHPKYSKIIKKRAPRASKIAQHHENLITQNQENPRKKSRKKDAARWRVMRAAHWINMFTKFVCSPWLR